MFWYIFISFFLLLILWILFAPLILQIDSDKDRYSIGLPVLFKARFIPSEEEIIQIRGWVLFIPWSFHPLRMNLRKMEEDKPKKKFRLKPLSGNSRLFKRLVRTFRIRRLNLDLCMDDFTVNAWLIPAFSMINANNIRMQVNFQGTSSLVLDVRTHIGSIFWVLISNKFKSFYQS